MSSWPGGAGGEWEGAKLLWRLVPWRRSKSPHSIQTVFVLLFVVVIFARVKVFFVPISRFFKYFKSVCQKEKCDQGVFSKTLSVVGNKKSEEYFRTFFPTKYAYTGHPQKMLL